MLLQECPALRSSACVWAGILVYCCDNASRADIPAPVCGTGGGACPWHNGAMVGSFNAAVYEVVQRIPAGQVATYGQVAALAGNPRNARFVGFALHSNPSPGVIPCHRVVFRDGSLAPGFAFGGPGVQRKMLEEEGVRFVPSAPRHQNAGEPGWVVDMKSCQWQA